MKFLYLLIIILTAGCSSTNNTELLPIVESKQKMTEQDIQSKLEEWKFLADYYENAPALAEMNASLKLKLKYVDAVIDNQSIFALDSIKELSNQTFINQKEQAELILNILDLNDNALKEEMRVLELMNLKLLLIENALMVANSISFRLDEPIVLIEPAETNSKNKISGTVRFLMGSSNMENSIEEILVNGVPININKDGSGNFQIKVTDSTEKLEAKIKMKHPINGKYIFESNKDI